MHNSSQMIATETKRVTPSKTEDFVQLGLTAALTEFEDYLAKNRDERSNIEQQLMEKAVALEKEIDRLRNALWLVNARIEATMYLSTSHRRRRLIRHRRHARRHR
ncbi:hypothetical protein PGTUg99_036681 [Puccinia graminis f. sp. tritici]|uniref:Uncharacterized protein n=1 Tax=Puccinia graminis f. sp. tritici TaxID=56615 RepID=A0A5B0PNR9_PUCGR|nr:hypothetical protein PGTUg99_036681 [Puccinia graminis f. sp. tritici]